MRKKKLGAIALAATLAVTTLLTGCGGSDKSKETSGGGKGDDGQVIGAIQIDLRTFDTAQCSDTASATILSNVMEGLFRYKINEDGDAILENAGASDCTISEDGLTYTVKLRENNWSDGEPITADDYVFAVERLLNPDLVCNGAFFAWGLVGAQDYYDGKTDDFSTVGVKAIDDMTVEYTLTAVDSAFKDKLANAVFFPLRRDIVESVGENYGTSIDGMVFSGPFKITQWSDKDTAVLEKNEEYWDADSVKLSQINMTYVDEATTIDQMFLQGDFVSTQNTSGEYLDKYKELAENGEITQVHNDKVGPWWMSFQMNGGPSGLMSNAKIRKAVGYAIDGQEICDTIYGTGTQANTFVPESITLGDSSYRSQVGDDGLWEDEGKAYRGNKEALQALFKEGLTELGLQTDDLSKYTISYLCYGDTSKALQVQEFYQQSIEKMLGINLELKVLADWAQYGTEVNGEDWDISVNGWTPDYNEPMTYIDMFVTGGSSNVQKFSSEEYDSLVEQAKSTIDTAERAELYRKCEQILCDEAVLTPIYVSPIEIFLSNDFKGAQILQGTLGLDWDYKYAYIEE